MDAHPNMHQDDDGTFYSEPAEVIDEPEPLKVAQVRVAASAKAFSEWFGERLGVRYVYVVA